MNWKKKEKTFATDELMTPKAKQLLTHELKIWSLKDIVLLLNG